MVNPLHVSRGVEDSALLTLIQGRDTRWWKGSLLKLNFYIVSTLSALLTKFIVLLTSMTVGYDGSMMNGLQSLSTWQEYFHHPRGGLLGLFNAIQSIGGIAGMPFAPYIADIYGRRVSIIIGCFIMILGAGIQTGARNVGMFIGARLCIGFGTSIAGVAAPMLVTELAFPTHRAPLTSLYNTSWLLGSIVAAWTTYGTFRMTSSWSWRIPSVLQALPSVVQLLFIYFIPESPRWLIDKGKEESARNIIRKFHCQVTVSLKLEKEAKDSSTWKSLFTTRANLRRMRIIIPLAFFTQWSGNGIVSYYLFLVLEGIGITSTGSQTLINGILQIWNYGGAILGALLVDRVGRRFLLLTSFAGMCLSFSAWTVCYAVYAKSPVTSPNAGAGHGVLAFVFIYYAFYVVALTPLAVSYPLEILPYTIRAKGAAVLQFSIMVSVIFNQYVNPIALEALGWKYYLVYCAWIAVEFVYAFCFFVETKGKHGPLPLEEIAALFEDATQRDRIVVQHDSHPVELQATDGESKGDEEQIEDKAY